MMTVNKESFSGVYYKGITWYNTCDNREEWLKSIYEHDKGIQEKVQGGAPIVTKLVVDGKRVE